jgi:hypothetical protein
MRVRGQYTDLTCFGITHAEIGVIVCVSDGRRRPNGLDVNGRMKDGQLPEGATYTAETDTDGRLSAF